MRRTLTLRRESLSTLTPDDLATVAAAAIAATGGCPWSLHVVDCLSINRCPA